MSLFTNCIRLSVSYLLYLVQEGEILPQLVWVTPLAPGSLVVLPGALPGATHSGFSWL